MYKIAGIEVMRATWAACATTRLTTCCFPGSLATSGPLINSQYTRLSFSWLCRGCSPTAHATLDGESHSDAYESTHLFAPHGAQQCNTPGLP